MAFFNFLALPGELRNMIYRFALTTDPPELEREHKYDCKKCTWSPHVRQQPMWDFGSGNSKSKRWPGCRCWARSGLDLLLANRQISWEGGSIFWAENHFTFHHPGDFIDLVGTRLRPRWRKMLGSISIFYWLPLPYGYDPLSPTCDRFWRFLFECRGLGNLELDWRLRLGLLSRRRPNRNRPDVTVAAWEDFKRLLPKLNTFTVVFIANARFKNTYSMDMKALSPKQIKDVSETASRHQVHGLINRELICWAFTTKRRPSFPSWLQIIEDTGSPHEYSCNVLLSNNLLRYTAKKFLEPLSSETIARNRELIEAPLARTRSRKKYGWDKRLRPKHWHEKITYPP